MKQQRDPAKMRPIPFVQDMKAYEMQGPTRNDDYTYAVWKTKRPDIELKVLVTGTDWTAQYMLRSTTGKGTLASAMTRDDLIKQWRRLDAGCPPGCFPNGHHDGHCKDCGVEVSRASLTPEGWRCGECRTHGGPL